MELQHCDLIFYMASNLTVMYGAFTSSNLGHKTENLVKQFYSVKFH